ncbi:MAG: PAS domain-containing protein [Candidatus Obscuribacterales bacterium]|nr:PAS domain-containing protein [Candidatus Obscuribacterales bacterium]
MFLIDRLLLRLRFRQKGIALVAVPLLFELLFVAFLTFAYFRAEHDSEAAEHGRQVLVLTDAMTSALFAMGASVVLSNNWDVESVSTRSLAIEATLGELAASLVNETKDSSPEAKLAADIAGSLKDLGKKAETYRQLLRDPFSIAAINIRRSRKEAKDSLNKIAAALDALVVYEQKSAIVRQKHADQSRRILATVWCAGLVGNIGLSVLFALVFSGQVTSRLLVVGRNAERMSRKEPLSETVSGNDELAELDKRMRMLSLAMIDNDRKERAMIDNAADTILALSRSLVITAVNSAAENLLRWDGGKLRGSSILDLVSLSSREEFTRRIENCFLSQDVQSIDCTMLTRDGVEFESRWSVVYSRGENSLFCIVRDVTSEKQSEKLKEKFFSMVTHDIRSPVATVSTFMELLSAGRYGDLNSDGQILLRKVRDNLGFVTTLTNDLLDLGKLQSTRQQLQLSSFAVEDLIDECCGVVEGLSGARSVRIKVENFDNLQVTGDFTRLKQALANLLSNAIKFSPENSTVTVRAELQSQSVRFLVKDLGAQLPALEYEKLFEEYVQSDNQDLALVKGYGLGLSIVSAIVSSHSGAFGANAGSEGGSEFWFTVPLRPQS